MDNPVFECGAIRFKTVWMRDFDTNSWLRIHRNYDNWNDTVILTDEMLKQMNEIVR